MKRRFDVIPARHVPHQLRAGALVLAALALALYAAITRDMPMVRQSGRVVRAEFVAANQIGELTPVRVAGVDVGRVERVTPGSRPGTALVTMRLSDDGVGLHRDARADIRWRTVLGGNMYIELEPGSPSAPPLGGATIPARRTGGQVELDDVTQVFDGGTAAAQRTMLRELRRGLGDPGATARALEDLGPTLKPVARGLEPLRGRDSDDLQALVASAARATAGLGRDTAALRTLVDGAARTLAVTGANRRALGELIEQGPASLKETAVTTRRLRVTLDRLDPLVARLRPGARAIDPATRTFRPALLQARALLREAHPLLRAAGPALAALRRASDNGAPLLRALDPTVRRLDGELLPWLERRDASTRLRTYEAIGPFFAGVDGVGAEFSDLGHVLQFPVGPGPNSALGLNAPPLTRACRSAVAGAARERCPRAARLLATLLGGAR